MFLFFDRQVMLDRNMIGVFLSISSAVASLEPRDYRGVFVYTKKTDRSFFGCGLFFYMLLQKFAFDGLDEFQSVGGVIVGADLFCDLFVEHRAACKDGRFATC